VVDILLEYARAEDPDALAKDLIALAAEDYPEWWTLEDIEIEAATNEQWDALAKQIVDNILSTYVVPDEVAQVLPGVVRLSLPNS
jgi:hypothetical protein